MAAAFMRPIIERVATEIAADVEQAADWTIEKVDPVWRNPANGKFLFVYAGRRAPDDTEPRARHNGGRFDAGFVTVEYQEPVDSATALSLNREEDAELALYDTADVLTSWADAHQSLAPVADFFDWMETSYGSDVRREMFVRYVRLTFRARKMVPYAD